MKKHEQMAEELLKRYDAISKLDAAKFLKDLFPEMTFKDFKKAYTLAYE